MRIVLLLDEGGSYRDIEEKLGAPSSAISHWKEADLKPHAWIDTWLPTTRVEQKAAAIIGLYLDPRKTLRRSASTKRVPFRRWTV